MIQIIWQLEDGSIQTVTEKISRTVSGSGLYGRVRDIRVILIREFAKNTDEVILRHGGELW